MAVDFHSLSEHFERVYLKRLAFRQVSLSDSWPLFQATRNPLFNKSLLWSQPEDDVSVLKRIDSILAAARRGRLTALSVVIKDTGEWVSLFRFQPYAANPEWAEMGVWTSDRYWHGRYSLELGRACIDAAFELSDVPRLVGAASPDNRSSLKLMEATGMKPTKIVFRNHESGGQVELQEFEITREEWLASRSMPLYNQVAAGIAGQALLQRTDEILPTGVAAAPSAPAARASRPRQARGDRRTHSAGTRLANTPSTRRGRTKQPDSPDPNQLMLPFGLLAIAGTSFPATSSP